MRSVYRDATFEDLVKRLAEQQHPNLTTSLFRTMRELLCFCAVVGYNNGKRRELGKKREEIPARVFEGNDFAMDLIYLLALCETKSADILKPENESDAVRIFEEYANGGLECLKGWLANTPTDAYGDLAIVNALREQGLMETGVKAGSDTIVIEI